MKNNIVAFFWTSAIAIKLQNLFLTKYFFKTFFKVFDED